MNLPCCWRVGAASYSAVQAHRDRDLSELCVVMGVLHCIVRINSTFAKDYRAGYALWGAWVCYPGRPYSGITYRGSVYQGTTYPGTTYPGTTHPVTTYPGGILR